jgi:general secretion pathway protein A
MYETFFGLRERPFELTPDPRFLFLSGSHREALSNLEYGILGRKCLTVLVGEVGTGKTTLLRRTLAHAREQGIQCVFVNNPTMSPADFAHLLARKLDLPQLVDASAAVCLEELELHLAKRYEAGVYTALVIDEAQALSDEMLEQIRLISNLETDSAKLLPIVLVGQPELADRLKQPALRNLKQRVALRCTLAPLDEKETASYIASRITIAGGTAAALFTREAVQAIHTASRGLPRSITVICDNALMTAFASGERPVTARTVRDVLKDFDVDDPISPAAVASVAAPRAEAKAPEPPAPPAPVVAEASQPREMFSAFRRRRFSFLRA